MLITFVVSSTLVLGGMALGRMIARGLMTKNGEAKDAKDADPKAQAPPAKEEKPPAKPQVSTSLEGFPCQLGDVLTRPGGDEAWLAGALVFSEDVPVSVLFIAPDAGEDRGIYVRPEPTPSFLWLRPIDAKAVMAASEPPSSIEHQGVRFERLRRLPLRARRLGTGAPDVGEEVIVAEYGSPGVDRIVVVANEGAARAWRGDALDMAMVDVLPSGKSTLDS